MKKQDLPKKLPDSPGVYFFRKGLSKRTLSLYIGKATSLKERVNSYFTSDIIKTRGERIENMVTNARSLDYLPTDSVLEAIILEAYLIKKYQPQYNVIEKDDKSFNYIGITKEDYPKVLLVRGKKLNETQYEYKYFFGPFPKSTDLKQALKIIRKIFPFRDKCIPISSRPCFNRQIGLCPGVCSGEATKKEYNSTIKNLKLFFEGRKKQILNNLEREMKILANKKKFEKAQAIKNQIFSLNHIQDIALLKRENLGIASDTRIEGYDISHISGTSVVGAMCVIEWNDFMKSDYRKFKIKSGDKNDDIGNLKEILRRRLSHRDWKLPNVIVVDGSKAQINCARNLLKSENLTIPVVGVVKNKNHKASKIIGSSTIINKYKNNILRINEEVHRFAIKYHKKVRSHKFK